MSDPNRFGEEIAATYDEDADALYDADLLDRQVALLAELAEGGPALELGIGTGRVAIPLAARGIAVAGIDLSAAMVERMRAKPGGDASTIPVVVGDMASERAPGAGGFRVVYVVSNSLMNVTSQDAQVDTFRNAAAHLAPGGRLLVEIMVPELLRLVPGERYVVFDQSEGHVGIDEYDVASQRMWSHHIDFRPDGRVRRTSPPFRYAWPAELDLMARLAGLFLEHRWAGWKREPFTSESRSHVSVWRKPLEPGPIGGGRRDARPG